MTVEKMNVVKCNKQQKILVLAIPFNSSIGIGIGIGIGNTFLPKYCYWFWQ